MNIYDKIVKKFSKIFDKDLTEYVSSVPPEDIPDNLSAEDIPSVSPEDIPDNLSAEDVSSQKKEDVSDLVYDTTKKAIISDKSRLRINNGLYHIIFGSKRIILGQYKVYLDDIHGQSPSFELTRERISELNELFNSEYKLREEKGFIKALSEIRDSI